MDALMNINPLNCPPASIHFKYDGEDAYEGYAKEIFRCGMYLMLNYDGPQDSQALFQEVFSREIQKPEVNKDIIDAIAALLVSQLMSFDEWFYDEVLERIFQLIKQREVGKYTETYVPELAGHLLHRGYVLTRTRSTYLGAKLQPLSEI